MTRRSFDTDHSGLFWLYAFAGLLALIELFLWLGPILFAAPGNLRSAVLEYGAFWPGLLGNWQPNYPQQPYAMFITYGFLHAGPGHLAVNLITLLALGKLVWGRVGWLKFIAVYGLAMVGGALGYGVLATGPQPMVGASGALFGLAGAVLAWDYIDRYSGKVSLWPVARAVGFLVVLNLVMWWAMQGLLAWQTHLGGFVLGWVSALLVDPVARDARSG